MCIKTHKNNDWHLTLIHKSIQNNTPLQWLAHEKDEKDVTIYCLEMNDWRPSYNRLLGDYLSLNYFDTTKFAASKTRFGIRTKLMVGVIYWIKLVIYVFFVPFLSEAHKQNFSFCLSFLNNSLWFNVKNVNFFLQSIYNKKIFFLEE